MYPNEERYSFAKHWSPEIAEFNFTQVPNILLGCQGHLEITDGELLTLLHLLTFRFKPDSDIWPSITLLTRFSEKHFTTIQKRLRILEQKGFVKRIHIQGTSNRYDISPCIRKLNKHIKVCKHLPRKQAVPTAALTGLPSSYSSSKEDEDLNIQTKEKLTNYSNSRVIVAGNDNSLNWAEITRQFESLK